MTTPQGFLYPLLLQNDQVFQGATPSKKVTPYGFLKYLLSNGQPDIVNKSIDDGSGQIRSIQVKYRKRGLASETSTDDNCAIDAVPVYSELTVPTTLFRKISLFIADATIAKYEKEASETLEAGKPASPFMRDFYNAIIEKANGLFAGINADLVSAQASAFGVNNVTGSNAVKAINFPQDATKNYLDQGITEILSDLINNEMRNDDCTIVGNGLINNYFLQRKAKTANGGLTGLDTNELDLPRFLVDPQTTTTWGQNYFGIFERNAAQFLNINLFDGWKGGDKMVSIFGTITLPIVDFMGDGELQGFKFDYQLKYNDCNTTEVIGGVSQTVGRGWIFTLMANYNMFNIPGDAYAPTDRLYQNNGCLLYSASNM